MNSAKYKRVKISEIADYVSRGITPKYVEDNGVVVINQRCIRGGRILVENAKVTDITRKVSTEKYLQCGDILINSTGVGTVGRVALVKSMHHQTTVDGHVTIVRINKTVADPMYVYYCLYRRQGDIALLAKGSTGQVELSRAAISDISIDLPDLDTQKKIADTLSAFDDKIELNRQMNETLEEMGRSLFRRYFIDNSEAKNWPMVKVGDLIKPKRGKSLVARVMKKGRVPVVGGGLSAAGMHNVANTTAPVVTVSASGANAGYVSLWSVPVWSSDSSYIDSTVTPYVYYWYFFLKNKQKEIFDMQTGTGQPHIYPSHIGLLDINDAPERAISRFNVAVEPLFSKVAANDEETLLQGSTRDMLAEKLIR